MRIIATLFCLALLSACGPADRPEEVPPPSDDMNLEDFAGTWNTTARLEGVEEPVQLQIVGSADGSDWTANFPDRDPVPMQASVEGDSLIGVSDQYESILRPGVMVHFRTANARWGDTMSGTVRVVYHTEDGDEVVMGTMESTLAE